LFSLRAFLVLNFVSTRKYFFMSATEPGRNDKGKEPSSRKEAGKAASSRRVPGVNFDELNFEQRRPPYNSGQRTIKDGQYNRSYRNEPLGGAANNE
jgi:hypothetical protein